MALSIVSRPSIWESAHSDLIYTLKDEDKVSDPVTYPNFKFIADIYVTIDGSSTIVARLKVVPDPATGIGIFNVGMVVRSYVNSFFDPVPNVLLAQSAGDQSFCIQTTINFGEEWDYTPTFNILIDVRTFHNSYNFRGQRTLMDTVANRVATNRPTSMSVFLNSSALFLPYYANANSPIVTVPIIIIPKGGGFSLTTSFLPAGPITMSLLNLAPNVINSLQPGTINAATTSYTIQIGADIYTVHLICESVYQPYAIHFLNQYGGFDTKIFSKVSRDTISVVKTAYGKLPYAVDPTGAVTFQSQNGVFVEQNANYSSLFQEKMSLNTDFLTDAEYKWLRELLISPLVIIEDGGGLYVINITDTDYEAKKAVNDDLTNLTMNIQFGNQLNAQFR